MTKIGDFKMSVIGFVFLVLASVSSAWAQGPTVQATVDRNELGLGDTLTLSVSVRTTKSSDISEPKVPDLPDFELINTWGATSSSSQMRITPSGPEVTQTNTRQFNYMMAPQKTGKLEIGAFEVVADGKTYRTAPILIEVYQNPTGANAGKPRQQQPRPDEEDEEDDPFAALLRQHRQQLGLGGGLGGGAGSGGGMQDPAFRSLPKNPNEAFFIQVELDKTEVFEGEQILANWYIYTRGEIAQLDRLKFPDLRGFWKEDIEPAPTIQFSQELVNGVPYKKALLGSYAMFPIRSGTQYVDEYKVKAVVRLPVSGMGIFGLGQPYTYTRSSEKVKITVKPLPAESRPKDFAGAVGQFGVSAMVDGQSFPVGQPFVLKLRFEGEGNAKLIELPEINLPPSLELYDKKSDSKFFRTGRSYKEFEVLLIPREQGELVIPQISFSFFDPKTKKYETRSTQSITLKIGPPVDGKNLPNERLADQKTKSAPAEPALPSLALNLNSNSWISQMPLGGVWFGVYLAILLALFARARQVFEWGRNKKDLKQILANRLKKTYKLVESENHREVGREMINAVYGIVGELSELGGSGQELSRLLDQLPPSVRREVGDELQKKMELFQMLAFAPEEMLGELKSKQKMRENVKATEKLLYQALSLRSSFGSSTT
ncbi:MAG: BatD family protein [Pseudobdellovibrionaceae bacterium]